MNIENSESDLDIESENKYKIIFWDSIERSESSLSDFSFFEQKIGDFNLIGSIGSGWFGNIYHAYDESKRTHYALKVLDKERVHKSGKIERVLEEKMLHSCMDFEFITRLAVAFQDNNNLYFAYPFCSGGNLSRYIEERSHFTEGQARFYVAQIIFALEYLHSLKLIHRNVKPENVLISADGYIKLSGFFFCKKLYKRAYSVCGTPEYFSPEILTGKGYGEEVDWWALGCTLYELITKRTPFQEDSLDLLYENIVEGRYRVPCPPFSFSTTLRRLLRSAFEPKLERRIRRYKSWRYHPFFAEIDLHALVEKTIDPPIVPENSLNIIDDHFQLKNRDGIRSSSNIQDDFGSWFNSF